MGLLGVLLVVLYLSQPFASGAVHPSDNPYGITPERIASALKVPLNANQFPQRVELSSEGTVYNANITYTLDQRTHDFMEQIFRSYSPDYGAFVAMDASTGRILSLVSYTRKPSDLGNLSLRALFPAASVFKVVTAAAALDQHKMTPDTVITFNGANHTLFKRNVTELAPRRRRMTLREAFAKSVNTVFGRLGVFFLHPTALEEYAERFAFNSPIPTDVPVDEGRYVLPGNDPWAMAEVASGYNRVVQMSPLQGALIAASIANDGIMMQPYLVSAVGTEDGRELYHADPKQISIVTTPEAAGELRTLMRETVWRGTSHRAFRGFSRQAGLGDVEVGGKTGTLEGVHPRGRTEWFVGYANDGDQRIAMSALTVTETRWRVKPSSLARYFIEAYFQPTLSRRPQSRAGRRHRRRHHSSHGAQVAKG